MRSTLYSGLSLQAISELIAEARSLAAEAARDDLSFLERGALNERLAEVREQLREIPGALEEVAIPEPVREEIPQWLLETTAGPDELEPQDLSEEAPPVAPRRQRRLIRMLLLALLLLIIGFGAGFAWMIGSSIFRAQQTASQSVQRFSQIKDALGEQTDGSIDSLAALQSGCEDAGALERDLKPITDLASAAGGGSERLAQVPGIGDRASSMVALAQAAQDIAGAVRVTCEAVGPIGSDSANAADASSIASSLLGRLAERRTDLKTAAARISRAQTQLQQVDETSLDESQRRMLQTMREKLGPAAGRLALLAEAPVILGLSGPRSYLVLGQNSDELRPSGGFIGTSGIVTFEAGRVVTSEYGSSFAQALPSSVRVPPPAPLERYMSAQYWQFWESNWWPDFPSSARQAEYFHNARGNQNVDGVIAVNERIIRNLLRVTGPVDVPDFSETVSADTVQERLDFHVHEANYADPVRKKFVTSLFGSVMARLNGLPRERFSALSAAISDGFRDQDLMMWTSDSEVSAVLKDLGWDGAMLDYQSDYLEVVSANLSANKVNRDVRQQLDYRIQGGSDGQLTAQVTLEIANTRVGTDPGPFRTADYRDYVRVYAPAGARLLSNDGFDEPAETLTECGRTAFAGFVTVRPEQGRTMKLTYALPPSVKAQDYALTLQKQPGVRPFPVRVQVLDAAPQQLELGPAVEVQPNSFGPIRSTPTATSGVASASFRCAVYTEPPTLVASPREISIPRIGVSAPIVELGIEPSGVLEAPSDGKTVGWYPTGARPGQGGNMVVSGHLDWDRAQAVFWNLDKLQTGDRISITGEDSKQHTYAVEWTRRYEAKDAPLNQILGPTTGRWLTIITCGGQFDRQSREYLERVVVRAQLVS